MSCLNVVASVVVTTFNNVGVLRETLPLLVNQDFNGFFEVIVVNDGSTDGTREFLEGFLENFGKCGLVVVHQDNLGVCKARNVGFGLARGEFVINMDHDCYVGRDWLFEMVSGFEDEGVGVVSSLDFYGGSSTAFRKVALDLVKEGFGSFYDEEYYFFREDTDLSFRVMELGFEFNLIPRNFWHNPVGVKPREDLSSVLPYALERLRLHWNDVLLFKKHSELRECRDFLHVWMGFLVNPWEDFKVATGLWTGSDKPIGKFELSSPRGFVFLRNESFLHWLVIVVGGIGYVLAIKFSRLIGSFKHGKLLI